MLETLVRDVWMLSLGADEDSLVNADVIKRLRKVSEQLDTKRPTIWISQIEEMREQLIVNINRKPATDALFLTMAAASASVFPPRRRYIVK